MSDDPVSPLAEALVGDIETTISHDLSAGDTFTHETLLVTCTVESVDDSGHVDATDHRGEEHQFDREVINRGLSEGFIQRGESR